MRRRTFIAAALVVTLSAREAGADDTEWTHLKTPSSVTTDGGSNLRLPPGYFIDEPGWQAKNAEMKRLQEQEVRLAAENKSLRDDADDISFGWYVVASALVVGFGAGIYLGSK
jgi:hypothetical protein